jgi:hypothetical protein
MAEHRLKGGSEDQPEEGDLLREELERERRWERAEERRVSHAIGLTDLLAVLMVAATGFSAFATWRTAQVTSLVFAIADRPFMGVSKIDFEATDSPDPHLTVVYKNFGRIPAADGLVSVDAWIDGKPAPDPFPGAMDVHESGGIPPDVDHFFYRYFTADSYKDVVSGKARLRVEVRIDYTGLAPNTQYCDSKRFVYDYRTATFRHAGGSNKCRSNEIF